MVNRRNLSVKSILFLTVLAILCSLFFAPSEGVTDNGGVWPIGQIDSSGDSTESGSSIVEPGIDTEEYSLFDLALSMLLVSIR